MWLREAEDLNWLGLMFRIDWQGKYRLLHQLRTRHWDLHNESTQHTHDFVDQTSTTCISDSRSSVTSITSGSNACHCHCVPMWSKAYTRATVNWLSATINLITKSPHQSAIITHVDWKWRSKLNSKCINGSEEVVKHRRSLSVRHDVGEVRKDLY